MAKYTVNQGCCICGECLFQCSVGAITIDKNGAHINAEKCIGCGSCYNNCASEAISETEE